MLLESSAIRRMSETVAILLLVISRALTLMMRVK